MYRNNVEVLIPRQEIHTRVQQLGEQITNDYQGKSLVLLSVLKGSFVFTADLARAIDLPLRIEFLGVQSYGDSTTSSGVVQITQDLTRPIAGEDLLIVEDIVDTGLTSAFLIQQLAARGPASVELCALLHKPSRAVTAVRIAYLGFTIEDVFAVGYGLDVAQLHRNLPDLCVYRQEGSVAEATESGPTT
jgi:hypoxanthine phosphoribosyltransferase